MKVLDLFCGLGGWGRPFRERGHEVIGVDIEPRFKPDIVADVRKLRGHSLEDFDLVLASPPCEAFSVASIGHHWAGGWRAYEPKTDAARDAVDIVHATLRLIAEIGPRWWVVENPRGVLRKLPPLADYERVTVTFCAYGETRMKPTDLWGGFPEPWRPRPMCRNGAPCHERAPRGAKTGTQGIRGAAARAVIPQELSLSICLACEAELAQ